MKRLLLILFSAVFVLSCSSCGIFNDKADKEDIIELVVENRETLIECIESGDYSELDRFKYRKILEIDVNETSVDFYCGGSGFGPSTSYCGFFYSAEGSMRDVWCAPLFSALTPEGDGYIWREHGGDNSYYVQPICDNFFYYESYY